MQLSRFVLLFVPICMLCVTLGGCGSGMTTSGTGPESGAGPGFGVGPVTGSGPAPVVVGLSAQAGDVAPDGKLEAQFSEAMDAATIDATSFTVTDSAGKPAPGVVSYDPAFDIASFLPHPALKADESYTATITTAAASADRAHLKSAYRYKFTTRSNSGASAIAVKTVAPAANATCVGATAPITITFNQAPDAATLTFNHLIVSGHDGAIAVNISTDVTTTQVVLAPASPLPSGAITVLVSNVGDLAGNPMTAAYTWSFSTACGGSGAGKEYLYASTAGTTNLYAYAIDPATGILTPVSALPFQFSTGGAPTQCGTSCSAPILADPLGRFLFYAFTWSTSSGFGTMKVDATSGVPTNAFVLPTTADNYGAPQGGLSIDPQGRFLFGAVETNHAAAGLQSWLRSVDVSSGGELLRAPGEPFLFEGSTNPGSFEGTANPGPPAASDSYVYVSGTLPGATSEGFLTGFSINQTSGFLSEVGITGDGPAAYAQAMTPSGKFLYSEQLNTATNGLQVVGFRVNADGSLTVLPQALEQTPDQPPSNLIISPNGNFLFHVGENYTSGSAKDIRVYAIDPNTGSLLPRATYSDIPFASTEAFAIDPSGQYVYIVEESSATQHFAIEGFTVEPTYGFLIPTGQQTPFPAQPGSEAIVRPQ